MALLQVATTPSEQYQDAHLMVDFRHETAKLDFQSLDLTRKEYDLLAVLVRNAGELVPREALLTLVWGYSPHIRTRTLDVHIRRLRKHLGRHGKRYIETVFGIGYRFQPCRSMALIEAQAAAPMIAREARPTAAGK